MTVAPTHRSVRSPPPGYDSADISAYAPLLSAAEAHSSRDGWVSRNLLDLSSVRGFALDPLGGCHLQRVRPSRPGPSDLLPLARTFVVVLITRKVYSYFYFALSLDGRRSARSSFSSLAFREIRQGVGLKSFEREIFWRFVLHSIVLGGMLNSGQPIEM